MDLCPYYAKYGNGRMPDNSNNERMTKKKWDSMRANKNKADFERNSNETAQPV